MKIYIIANGTINNIDFHRKILSDSDYIICADGGANHAKRLGIKPDVVVGDMDSVNKNFLEGLNVIYDPDQDKTDLEIALFHANKKKYDELILLGCIGDRLDHTISNIFSVINMCDISKVKILDDINEINIVDSQIVLNGKQNDIISIIALTEVSGLMYEGLKWDKKGDVKKFWIGTSNRMTNEKAKISLTKGLLLVIKTNENILSRDVNAK